MHFTDEEMNRVLNFIKIMDELDEESYLTRADIIRADTYRRFFDEFVFLVSSYKLLIAGSRGITDIDISKYIPDRVELIMSGGAKGIDTLAEQYADKHKLSKLIIRPDYNAYGRNAPLIRNKAMVAMCDEVLVFWDGKSRGTKFTIDCAKERERKITVIDINKTIKTPEPFEL